MSNITSTLLTETTYSENRNIVSVNLDYVPWKNNDMTHGFRTCMNLVSVSNINKNVTNMFGTFELCYNLKTPPVIPNSVTNMDTTFRSCLNLETAPILPNSLKDMSTSFQHCFTLTEAPTIPNGVTNMEYSFYNCRNIINAPTAPSSVVNMNHAYSYCTNMESDIIVPNRVGDTYCLTQYSNKISNVYIESHHAYGNVYGWSSYNPINIYIPFGNCGTYKRMYSTNVSNVTYLEHPNCSTMNDWYYMNYDNSIDLVSYTGSETNITIPSSLNNKPTTASITMMFENNQTLVNVSADDTMRNIIEGGRNAFSNCRALQCVDVLGSNISSLEGTFYNCTNLTSVNGMDLITNVTTMNSMFYNCVNLTQLPNIPNGIIDMDWTYFNCSKLTFIPTIPNSVIHMNGTFRKCNKLSNFPTIPNGVQYMVQTYMECTNLTITPSIPNGVINMYMTFNGCSGLKTTPIIPNSVIDMSDTFRHCYNLTNIQNIPDSVTNMYGTFSGCYGLISAQNIPENVKNIAWVYNGCTNLSGDLYVKSDIVSNATSAFYEVPSLNVYCNFYTLEPRQEQLYAYYDEYQSYQTFYVKEIPSEGDSLSNVELFDSTGNSTGTTASYVTTTYLEIYSDYGYGLYATRNSSMDIFLESFNTQTYDTLYKTWGSSSNITLYDTSNIVKQEVDLSDWIYEESGPVVYVSAYNGSNTTVVMPKVDEGDL